MPDKHHVLTMARYNMWQNQSQLHAASSLDDAALEQDRGAFFGSIRRTLSHLFWADQLWLSRFAQTPPPTVGGRDSVNFVKDWNRFPQERLAMDRNILNWAHSVAPDWFEGSLKWTSVMLNGEQVTPRRTLVLGFFNHQTHHRGQIHAMLTAAGARPEDTDIIFMPERFAAI